MSTPEAASSDVVASVVAVPVAGGVVTVETRAVYDAGGAAPGADWTTQAAAWLRTLDPQELRGQVATRAVSMADDPFAAALAVLAEMLEGET